MQVFKVLLISISIVLISSCGDQTSADHDKEGNSQDSTENLSNYTPLGLEEYGINGSILIPNDAKGETEVSENAYGGVEIRAGNDYAIEILPLATDVESKKNELANNPIYKINYIEESDDYILYSKDIENSGIDTEYHLYMVKEFADGEKYEIKTMELDNLSKASVKKILSSLKNSKVQA